jgi:hypothetical protein
MNRGTVIRWTVIVLLAVGATLLTRSCRTNADAAQPAHAWVVATGAGDPAEARGASLAAGDATVLAFSHRQRP